MRALVLVVAGFTACHPAPARLCSQFGAGGRWHLAMTSRTGNQLDAEISASGDLRRLVGTATSPEGTREPLDYTVDSLSITADSVRFRFAPLGILVEGRCVTTDRIEGRFVEPQPPFQPITGSGEIRRIG
jgi:hypothetical protein